jgi:Holliday junction DNA helicase RuvB
MPRPPKTFHEFIGQTRVIQYLVRLIAGAKALGSTCPSMLLIAPAGAGKTTLGRAIAAEYGSDLYPLLAGKDTRAVDLCDVLFQLKHGDVFFIDEAHSLHRDAQQILYDALQDNKVPALREGRLHRSHTLSIAQFTLILASNEPGMLKIGLIDRVHRFEFDPYSIRELKAIAEYAAGQEDIEMTPQAARRLAEVAQGTPRSLYRRLEALRLLYPSIRAFTIEHVRELLTHEGIDENGFTPHQRLYLLTLAATPQGRCSLGALAGKLGCDDAHIHRDIEPYLIEQGLVDPSSGRGRLLTAEGRRVVATLAAHHQEQTPEEERAC